MNLIAAVIFTDDIHNDGGSRASYFQETSEAACRCIEHTIKEVSFEYWSACLASAEQTYFLENHVIARWTDIEMDRAF